MSFYIAKYTVDIRLSTLVIGLFSDLVLVQNVHIVEGKKRKKKTNNKYLMEIAGLQYRNSLFTDSSRHRLKTNQKLASLLIRVDEDGRCCIPAGTVTTDSSRCRFNGICKVSGHGVKHKAGCRREGEEVGVGFSLLLLLLLFLSKL